MRARLEKSTGIKKTGKDFAGYLHYVMAPRDGLDNSDGIRIGRAPARPEGAGQGRHTGGMTKGNPFRDKCRGRQDAGNDRTASTPKAVRARGEK